MTTTTTTTGHISDLLAEAVELMDTPHGLRDELFEGDRAAFLARKDELLVRLRMADREYAAIDLTQAQAQGFACVVCEHEFIAGDPGHLPVGRARHTGQVFACAGDCYTQATAA